MIIYIDTQPGRGGLLSPPMGKDIVDYSAWLSGRYEAGTGQDGKNKIYFGAAQEINSLAYRSVHKKIKLVTIGPFADEAAAVIKALFPGVNIEVA